MRTVRGEARPGRPPGSSGNSLDLEVGRLGGELGPVADADLLQHVRDVTLDRLARKEELLRDLGIACPVGDQADDLALALRQGLGCGAAAPRPDSEGAKQLLRDLLFCESAHLGC